MLHSVLTEYTVYISCGLFGYAWTKKNEKFKIYFLVKGCKKIATEHRRRYQNTETLHPE